MGLSGPISENWDAAAERDLVSNLIFVKMVADRRLVSVADQGQAMSGYSELAEYRHIIDKLEAGRRRPPVAAHPEET